MLEMRLTAINRNELGALANEVRSVSLRKVVDVGRNVSLWCVFNCVSHGKHSYC
jgi:hypothetical protein